MKFTKMHGLGNDYIYIDEDILNPEKLSKRLSDRHFGIGSDGLIMVLPSSVADAKMRIFNADGSEATMCGNGIRCVGKFVYDKLKNSKSVSTVPKKLKIETLSGIKSLEILENGMVKVDMGRPVIECSEIPVISDKKTLINENFVVSGKDFKITCVSMGNPHCVVFLDDSEELKTFDIEKFGPEFEKNKIFPVGVNTEFVKIIDKKTIEVRVWERGSSETLACGTGSCATVAAAVENGYCEKNSNITVKLRGGNLIVNYNGDVIFMTGDAVKVFEGEVEV